MWRTDTTLAALREHVRFIEAGGYSSNLSRWRASLIFEESPLCVRNIASPVPCGECVLLQFVPSTRRSARIPCRHIPFDEECKITLDSLYRWGTQEEMQRYLCDWLRRTIQSLERVAGKAAQASTDVEAA